MPQVSRQRPGINAEDLIDGERRPDRGEIIDGRGKRPAVRRQERGVDRAGGHAGDYTYVQVGVPTRKPAKQSHLVRRARPPSVEDDGQIVMLWLGGGGRLSWSDRVRRDVFQRFSRITDSVRKLSRTWRQSNAVA